MTANSGGDFLIRDIRACPDVDPDALAGVGRRVADHVIDEYRTTGQHPRGVVRALSELASSQDSRARQAGSRLIFSCLVEPLSDAFEPDLAILYDEIFAQVIDHHRRLPESRAFDDALNRFGIGNESDLLGRRRRLTVAGSRQRAPRVVRKAVILSRVTVGADVAVTSVILDQLRQTWPDAAIVLVGRSGVGELFAGDSNLEILETPYPRRGVLADRLLTWVRMVDEIHVRVGELPPGEVVFVDPDSRLTQLGLLPLTRQASACYMFESRSYQADSRKCLGNLAAEWAAGAFGGGTGTAWPSVHLSPDHLAQARSSIARLKRRHTGRIVSVSFGVGGNPAKRAGEPFEISLLRALIGEGCRVVMDRGIDTDLASNEKLLAGLRGCGFRVSDASADRLTASDSLEESDILTWTGGVGQFSALIGASDLYVGYDSAFQHVAAALEVPVVTVALGSPSARFRLRWTPWSRGAVRVLPEGGQQAQSGPEALVRQTLTAIRELFP